MSRKYYTENQRFGIELGLVGSIKHNVSFRISQKIIVPLTVEL